MKMLGYLTHDEVNEDQTRRMVEACAAQMISFWSRDSFPNGRFDASLFDLDSLPPDKRQYILADLLIHGGHLSVGVHSFHLDEKQASALRRNGVRVFRRLHQDVIRKLLNDKPRNPMAVQW